MGFLPCGLVYGALAVVATLGDPVGAATGMVCFGLGTVPLLTSVAWLGRKLPLGVRRHGSKLAALLLLLTAGVALGRGLWVQPSDEHCVPGHAMAPTEPAARAKAQ